MLRKTSCLVGPKATYGHRARPDFMQLHTPGEKVMATWASWHIGLEGLPLHHCSTAQGWCCQCRAQEPGRGRDSSRDQWQGFWEGGGRRRREERGKERGRGRGRRERKRGREPFKPPHPSLSQAKYSFSKKIIIPPPTPTATILFLSEQELCNTR